MEQIDRIVTLVRDVLGQDAIGAYRHGSAVLGGLQPHSDIDVLVVAKRPTRPQEKRILIDRLLPISGRGPLPGRSLEVTIVVESEIRPWRYPPRLDFQYGEWMRDDFERGSLAPWVTPNPDLALLLTVALQGDQPLFGPPPANVIDPIPQGDVIRSVLAGIPGLRDDLGWDTRNVVLTLARVWTTVATGAIRSKDAAAEWALARLPQEHRPVLAHARAVYLGDCQERWDDLRDRVGPLVDHIIREIADLKAASVATTQENQPQQR